MTKSSVDSRLQLIKSAVLGGAQDMPFEQAFSNLAHVYLKDKAPMLQDYEIGFQLVDRNNENTKAVGVFGFKVGSQWLYAPVFFINGDLKGHELLYLKNQDLFVPLSEKWVSELLNKKPHVLGKGTDKNTRNLGVVSPNFSQLTRSPAKYASADIQNEYNRFASWSRPVIKDLARLALTVPEEQTDYKFLDAVKQAGNKGVNFMLKLADKYPRVLDAVNTFYGIDNVNAAVKAAAVKGEENRSVLASQFRYVTDKNGKLVKQSELHTRPKPADVINNTHKTQKKAGFGVRIISFRSVQSTPDLLDTMTEGEKEKVQRGEVIIKDDRTDKETTVAYDVNIPKRLTNPTETGIYDVYTKPGEFRKCLVTFVPHTNEGRQLFVTVVDVKDKTWTNIHNSEVWCKDEPHEKQEFREWFDKLSDDSDLGRRSTYMLIGPTGQATTPFHIISENGGEPESFDVHFIDSAKSKRAGSLQRTFPSSDIVGKKMDGYASLHTPRLVRSSVKGKSLKALGKELIVPSGFKVLRLDDANSCCFGGSSGTASMLDLGSVADFESGILKRSEWNRLTVRHTGTHVYLNDGVPKLAQDALVDLVTDYGLREKQAREILDSSKYALKKNFLITKLAEQEYDLQKSGPSAPPFPEQPTGSDPMAGSVPTTNPQEYTIPIDGMRAQDQDISGYDPRTQSDRRPYSVGGDSSSPEPDQDAMQSAMDAAQSGQKELFDTSMLGSLLRSVNDESMVDKYIGGMIKGMDSMGRVLLMMYWHGEDFKERFGKQDTPEIENRLRNSFGDVGDLILMLKQKAIEPYPEEYGDVDMKSVAN